MAFICSPVLHVLLLLAQEEEQEQGREKGEEFDFDIQKYPQKGRILNLNTICS